jgi:hypothetical protein
MYINVHIYVHTCAHVCTWRLKCRLTEKWCLRSASDTDHNFKQLQFVCACCKWDHSLCRIFVGCGTHQKTIFRWNGAYVIYPPQVVNVSRGIHVNLQRAKVQPPRVKINYLVANSLKKLDLRDPKPRLPCLHTRTVKAYEEELGLSDCRQIVVAAFFNFVTDSVPLGHSWITLYS